MKKLFLLLTVLCAVVTAQAQVISAYTMQATQGTYTEITDGTAMDTTGIEVTDMAEKVWYPDGVKTELTTKAGFSIGFDFEFNDILCNQFVIGSNGYIALGRDSICNDPINGSYIMGSELGADNVIGVIPNVWDMWRWETTEFSYKVVGEAPSRTLVVQFKDWGPKFGWDDGGDVKMNMQIRLNEAGNTVQFVFGACLDTISDSGKSTRIGLRGSYDDLLTLTDGETEGMINYVATPGDNSVWLEAAMITSGITYTFTPPAACEAPTSPFEITDLVATTNLVSLQWKPLADADHVLLLLSKDYMLTEEPADGKFYEEGASLGGAQVLAYTTDTVYAPETWQLTLEPATDYYLHVYPANSVCAHGPVYGKTNAVFASFTTKPAAPDTVAITGTTLNTLTFDVEANGTDNVIVILTDSVRPNPPYASVVEFGTPDANTKVGDVLQDMGRVVYMGASAQNIVVEGLEPGTTYYLRALSYNDNYDYSTEYVQCLSATVANLPWALDLTNVDLGVVPAGWESTSTGNTSWSVMNKRDQTGTEDRRFDLNTTPNASEGFIADLTTPAILVDKRDALFTVQYCMYIWARFGGNKPYDAWEANDKFAVQISRNGGEFEEVYAITAENNVKVDSVTQFIPVKVDLSDYLNDEVRIRIHWECFNGSAIRCPLEGWNIDGRPIPVVPDVTVSDITWNSANVSWRGEQESYEFAYAKVGEEFAAKVVNEKAVTLTDLTHLTEYQVKVRGIVAEGDTTDWCEVVTFTTADLPVCPVPEGLAHATTEDYGDKLSWTINEEHLSWDLRYREGSSTSWTEVEGLETNEYTLYNLVAGASYVWLVRAHCDMDRVSKYASQEEFTANAKSAISAATADRLKVVAANGAVTIYNSDVYVESVTLLDVQGRVLGNYVVNARDNITIPTNATGIAIVLVNTVDQQLVYKVSF